MRRYPGNFTDSDLLSIPRTFKARPWAPEVNLAYVTKDEEKLLQKLKPDTPHEGPEKVPSYDSYGTMVGGKDVGTGGGDVRDTGGGSWGGEREDRGREDRGVVVSRETDYQSYGFDQEKINRLKEGDERVRLGRIEREREEKRKIALGTSNTQKMQRAQKAQKLGAILKNLGINKNQFDRYRNAGILPENIALQLGLVKPGEHWDPRGKFTEKMKLGLEEQQFALDEGVYGGVAGIEAEINKIKKQAMTGNQDERDAAYKQLDALFARQGKSPQETQRAVDQMIGQFGYDKTGMHTWSDIESDQGPGGLYDKYLNRGTLWDDPLSGILAPQKQINYGGGGGGGGGWSGWGSGGGGGGGGSSSINPPEQFMPQKAVPPGQRLPDPMLQAMISTHGGPGFKQGFRRGGIVSLVT